MCIGFTQIPNQNLFSTAAHNDYAQRTSNFSCCPCLQKIFTIFWNALKSCSDFFLKCFSRCFYPLRTVSGQKDYWYTSSGQKIPLMKWQRLTASQREHRIRMGTNDVQARLKRELHHAQNQMINEPDKPFVYQEAPAHFAPSIHEETVGNYQVGICHYQGRRLTMEDEHLAVHFNINGNPISLFGVFDGHGGSVAAQYVRDNLQRKLAIALVQFNPNGLTDVGIWNALKMTCVHLNEDFLRDHPNEALHQGATAAIALIINNKLWTANVGDSRILLDDSGQLTEDAKPEDPRYRRNIEHRGGFIRNNGVWRIEGDLACGRSIGDHRLHKSARPKITMVPLSSLPQGNNLYLGCDGIFDVASTRQILQAGSQHPNAAPGALARNVVYSAWNSQSGDNLSMLVVKRVN
jgi:serine/threonine protein phosphatase PrpC